MKTKIYYLFLLMIFFLMSCGGRTNNVSECRTIGNGPTGEIFERTIDGHDYIMVNTEYAHSGTCRKCKQERDSIVNLIIKTIKENKTNTLE